MNPTEAQEWINGVRSMTNMVPKHPSETWLARISQADAAMMQEAYWFLKANSEGLLDGNTTEKYVDIVFDGPPSHEAGRFVEVENENGESIKFGEWKKRDDEYWVLRITAAELKEA